MHLIERGFVNRSSKATKNIIEKINKRNENKCGNVQEHALSAVRQDAGDTSAVPWNEYSYVDRYLQPHAKALPSYVKDTLDFIKKISETENLTKNTFLVTLDIKSRNTNTPNHEGIEAINESWNSGNQKPISIGRVLGDSNHLPTLHHYTTFFWSFLFCSCTVFYIFFPAVFVFNYIQAFEV